MRASDPDESVQSELIYRLASHGIRYLEGGSSLGDLSPAPPAALLLDLARASSARLRSALIALLLRHPEYASVAEATARELPGGDPARRLLLLSVVVAAALQSEWSFSLDLYLSSQARIRAEHLAKELGLPSPCADFGRPCLADAARLLREGAVFPFKYEEDWENAARRLLSQLAREAKTDGA